jgi:hypothetical protein
LIVLHDNPLPCRQTLAIGCRCAFDRQEAVQEHAELKHCNGQHRKPVASSHTPAIAVVVSLREGIVSAENVMQLYEQTVRFLASIGE